MPELRFNLGHGYLRLTLSKNDMIKALVTLRHCNAGLYYNQNDTNPVVAHNVDYTKITKALLAAGLLRDFS